LYYIIIICYYKLITITISLPLSDNNPLVR